VIKWRKAQLYDKGKLEKVRKKKCLDFLDIILFDKMSLWGEVCDFTQKSRDRDKPCFCHGLARWRVGPVFLTNTCMLK
jgi:hypothetical protein